MSTNDTRRSDAIAKLGGADKARAILDASTDATGFLNPAELRAVFDLAICAIESPASDGAALRRLRSEMQSAWLACIENKKMFSVGTPDRRECQAEANAFQSVCFAIDRELDAAKAEVEKLRANASAAGIDRADDSLRELDYHLSTEDGYFDSKAMSTLRLTVRELCRRELARGGGK